jgi:carbon starvation protein
LGIGRFGAQIHPDLFFYMVSFGLLAFSSFVFDTLDVCTRLGRYVLQELTGLRGLGGGAVATVLTLAAPAVYLWASPPGSFRTFWIIFGTSNQLLAALTLVGVSVWLWRTGRPVWFALLPAGFMVASTATALVMNFVGFLNNYRFPPPTMTSATPFAVNMIIAAILFALAALVVFEAVRVLRLSRVAAESQPPRRQDANALHEQMI